jgi:hypothetical protein
MFRRLFLTNPADVLDRSDSADCKNRRIKLINKITEAYASARFATSAYEMDTAQEIKAREAGDLNAVLTWHARATASKHEMARECLDLAKALGNLMRDAVGSWVPAMDQAGTGLDSLELELINGITGDCEHGELP